MYIYFKQLYYKRNTQMYNFPSNLEYNKLSDTRNQINFE